MQTCNMDERTNEEVLKEKTPEILWPAIRQYRPQTGIGFQYALDIGEAANAVEALQQRNAEIEAKNADMRQSKLNAIKPLAELLRLALDVESVEGAHNFSDKIRDCTAKIRNALISANLKGEEV